MRRIIYRIEKKNGVFYPQIRAWLWGWNYFDVPVLDGYRRINFPSLDLARSYISKLNTKKENQSEYWYISPGL